MTHPSGFEVGYDYGAAGSIDNRLSRVAALTNAGGTLDYAAYTYLGAAAPEVRTPRQLFIDFHDAESIWVSAGVRRNRRVLFGTWLLADASLAFLLGVWDVHRTRKTAGGGPSQGPGGMKSAGPRPDA